MDKTLDKIAGQCLCGAIQFEISGRASSFHLCYCSRCRHGTGSAHAANIFLAPDAIRWLSGAEQIQRFELPSARSWAKQFCKVCGSAVPYVNRAGNFLVVPAGSLNDALPLRPDDRIFCADRSDWVDSIPTLPEFAGLPTGF